MRRRHLASVAVLFVFAPSACTGGAPSQSPHGASSGVQGVALSPPADVPPPAVSATPIAFKSIAFDEPPVRRPLVPMPAPIVTPTGTVDSSGDETPLKDVLIGTAPAASEVGKSIDGDLSKLLIGVRLVVDAPYEIFSKTGSYVHLAAFLPSFAPAAGARVYVDGKLQGRCDADGTFVFRHVPDQGTGNAHEITVVAGTGARVKGEAGINPYPRTQAFERAHLYVYTDRGVFSPGETIHVRAFAWRLRGDYRPFADAPVNVVLRKDGKLLGGGRIETDKMGIAWLDLPLPTTAPEGPYELAVEHLGERATARLQVKHIVAPAVKITHDLPRFLTRDDKGMKFSVSLQNATGEPFGAGTITIETLDPKGATVSTETRAVKGNGPHAFALTEATIKAMRDAFVDDEMAAVSIEVVDATTGRRDELVRDLRIARAPYRLVVEGDRTEHVPGETVKIVVHATDLEDAPLANQEIALDVTNENTGKSEKRVVAKSDATGLASATFVMPKASIDVVASLVKTPSITASTYVSESAPRAMFADVSAPSVIEREKTPIEVRFPSGYTPAERFVHADITDASGSMVHSFLVPIKIENGKSIAKGTFPAPSWGSMLMTFFAIGHDVGNGPIGLLTDGANLPVVASRPIEITLETPATATPGSAVSVDVTVARAKGAIGAGRPYALGLSIADDAMLSLLEPLEHLPNNVLYNPERKVMATTGAQILTWPVVQKTWGPGNENYDIALPPFGFRHGGFAPPPFLVGKAGAGKKYDYDAADDYGGGGLGGAGVGGAPSVSGAAGPSKTKVAKEESAPMPMPTSAPPKGAKPPPPPPVAAPSAEGKKPSTMLDGGAVAAKGGETTGASNAAASTKKKPDVAISIRTDFSSTSTWVPEAIVEADKDGKGNARFEAKLPDAIAKQRVTIVASDDRGAIGVGSATILVDQDLSVRSDLPPTLVEGDEVEVGVSVRNARKDAAQGDVTLASSAISVVGAASQPITVAGGASASVKFRVKANAAGSVPFTVAFRESRPAGSTSKEPLRDDTEQRTLWVRPRGAPVEQRAQGTLSSGSALSFDVERTADDDLVTADLSVAFPSAVPLVEGLDALVDDETYVGVDPDASRLLSAIAIEGYLLRAKTNPATIARVHLTLVRGAMSLLFEQQPDGGWGWRWDTWAALHGLGSASSPYTTTHALLALSKLRDTDVPVPDASIAAGRSYLLRALGADGMVDVSNVAFWEGDGLAKKRAATMSAFHAIAATEKLQKIFGNEASIAGKLADMASAIARGGAGSEDPLTLSEAVIGLHLHALANGDQSTTTKDAITAGTKAMLAAYRSGYWEPSWFHAWGGRIEATRGAIELLSTVAPGVYDADMHDAVQFLLSTRPSWGAWHNAWGTAAAIEALTFLDPTPPEKPGATVTIAIDGQVVKTSAIDPSDPFTSAASLRAVDLTPWLGVGDHVVRVAYDGALTVPGAIVVRRWTHQKVESFGVKIERALSANETSAGASLTQTLTLTSDAARPELLVEIPETAGLSVDVHALESLVRGAQIAGWREGRSLVVSIKASKAGATTLKLPYFAVRKGSFTLAPVHVVAPLAAVEGWSDGASVAVK